MKSIFFGKNLCLKKLILLLPNSNDEETEVGKFIGKHDRSQGNYATRSHFHYTRKSEIIGRICVDIGIQLFRFV